MHNRIIPPCQESSLSLKFTLHWLGGGGDLELVTEEANGARKPDPVPSIAFFT